MEVEAFVRIGFLLNYSFQPLTSRKSLLDVIESAFDKKTSNDGFWLVWRYALLQKDGLIDETDIERFKKFLSRVQERDGVCAIPSSIYKPETPIDAILRYCLVDRYVSENEITELISKSVSEIENCLIQCGWNPHRNYFYKPPDRISLYKSIRIYTSKKVLREDQITKEDANYSFLDSQLLVNSYSYQSFFVTVTPDNSIYSEIKKLYHFYGWDHIHHSVRGGIDRELLQFDIDLLKERYITDAFKPEIKYPVFDSIDFVHQNDPLSPIINDFFLQLGKNSMGSSLTPIIQKYERNTLAYKERQIVQMIAVVLRRNHWEEGFRKQPNREKMVDELGDIMATYMPL